MSAWLATKMAGSTLGMPGVLAAQQGAMACFHMMMKIIGAMML
jgi:hypothetical protein